MSEKSEKKRLFFAYEVLAPWPTHYPKGRVSDPDSRHCTLAFLGDIPYFPLQNILSAFPVPSYQVGPVGYFDKCLLLPENSPRVIAWHAQSFDDPAPINRFSQTVSDWLRCHEYSIDKRSFLPHVTIARSPFNADEWQRDFVSLPYIMTGIHLYESLGSRVYKPIWTYPLAASFDEIDHTADIAFRIRGESMYSLHLHAQVALAFKYPPLLPYIKKIQLKEDLDDIVIALNKLITLTDSDIGCPLKAVSFHGKVQDKEGVLIWEMIVDV